MCVVKPGSTSDAGAGYLHSGALGLDLRIRQIQMVFENTPAALLINSVSTVLASFIVYRSLPPGMFFGWFGGMICILSCRYILWTMFNRQKDLSKQAHFRWEMVLLVILTLNGVWWGAFGVLTFLYSGSHLLGFSGFVLGGMTAGAIATLGPRLIAYACFTLPAVTCMMLVLYWVGNGLGYVMLPLAIAFAAAMLVTVWKVNRIIAKNFELNLKNEHLVQSLLQSNSRLSVTNANLEFEIEERMRVEKQIEFLATHDVLTGLANRRLQEDRFARAAARAVRNEHRLALLFIDLDYFKDVNDSLGHPIGDRVLQIIAGRLKECLRSGESVCRQGGDEFLLLAEIDAAAEAEAIAQRIIQAVSEVIMIGERKIQIGASIGISMYPDHGKDFSQLVGKADQALYAAKREGKGMSWLYHGEAPVELEPLAVEA